MSSSKYTKISKIHLGLLGTFQSNVGERGAKSSRSLCTQSFRNKISDGKRDSHETGSYSVTISHSLNIYSQDIALITLGPQKKKYPSRSQAFYYVDLETVLLTFSLQTKVYPSLF